MSDFLKKKQWVIVLALGITGIAAGVSIFTYGVIVVQHGSFPESANNSIMAGLFIAGWGLGYAICSKTIHDLEKKIQK